MSFPDQFVCYRGSMVVRYAGLVDLASVRRLEAFAQEVARTIDRPLPILTVVEAGVALPDAGARAGLAGLWRVFAPHICALSYALMGTGFTAAARRAVVTGLQMLVRPPFPVHVDHELSSAARWLAQQSPPDTVDAGELVGFVEELRSRAPA